MLESPKALRPTARQAWRAYLIRAGAHAAQVHVLAARLLCEEVRLLDLLLERIQVACDSWA